MKRLFLFLTVGIMITSCVSPKKLSQVNEELKKCQDEKAACDARAKKIADKSAEQETMIKKLVTDIRQLKKDTAQLGEDKRMFENNYENLKLTYDILFEKNKKAVTGSEKETRRILSSLQGTQEELQKKEDSLKTVSKTLTEKEKNLSEMMKKFTEKEKRVQELESILARKDSVVKALKKTVNDALLGYIDKGLTVNIRNGKVYVSLEESLLFASASWQISQGGQEVLKKLAKILETNQDINVVIEGHTDNVPYKGASLVKDNWDLSVMRATSAVKIILNNGKIDPKRLSASGRSEFLPLDPANTKEARAKNRRTEIILTPKLDELFQILESN